MTRLRGIHHASIPLLCNRIHASADPRSSAQQVLVVENNPAMAEIEVLVLANADHEVISASNAQRALNLSAGESGLGPDATGDAYAAGACDYLPKPPRTGELLDHIRVHLTTLQAA
ncbi:hypothetical protein ACFROC_31975 [Nocardia tengchongensis]|uniref:hypothetical protein n=1 Tax=Nocardia tengchongensis TaxID=2055889 RepID=UPI003679FD41